MIWMAFISRLIQGAGWLWIAAGIASQMFDFGDISWFPGIILIFISRILRTQVSRQPQPDQVELPVKQPPVMEVPVPSVPERPLNTERRPEPAPTPPVQKPPAPKPLEVKKPPVVMEPIGLEEPDTSEPEPAEMPKLDLERTPRSMKSSEEMIAEARRRWDRRR
jgi:hypothetical protein